MPPVAVRRTSHPADHYPLESECSHDKRKYANETVLTDSMQHPVNSCQDEVSITNEVLALLTIDTQHSIIRSTLNEFGSRVPAMVLIKA